MALLNCGNDSHPAQITPPGSGLTNQFAFIRGGGGTAPTYFHESKGVSREKQHPLLPHGPGLKPWANIMNTGPHSVVLMNNDGTGENVVASQAGWFESIQLSVDGKAAVFSAAATGEDGNSYMQIFLVKASGTTYGDPVQLTTDAEDHYQPQLSVDGAKVVFVKYAELSQAYVVSAAGGTETLILTPAGQNVYSPTFTPNGKSIVYEDCTIDSINIVNLDGSSPAVLHNADGYMSTGMEDDTPAVSPDGKLIAFATYSINDEMEDIYVMDITGQNVKQLTTDGLNDDPMFVNKKIVFISDRDNVGTSEIYSMNADGTNQNRLTNNSFSEWFQTHDENIPY